MSTGARCLRDRCKGHQRAHLVEEAVSRGLTRNVEILREHVSEFVSVLRGLEPVASLVLPHAPVDRAGNDDEEEPERDQHVRVRPRLVRDAAC